MALDWSKEISFSGITRRKKRPKSVYPEKRHMNLLPGERRQANFGRSLLSIVVVALAVGLIVKFGIFDFYLRVADHQVELSQQKQVLSSLQSVVSEYDDVLAEYESYESTGALESGPVIDAIEALALVDACATPNARVASLSLEGDTMSLKLAETTLDRVGDIVASLEEQEVVANVLLSTAATQQQSKSDQVTATITVTLQPAGDKPGDAGEGEVG